MREITKRDLLELLFFPLLAVLYFCVWYKTQYISDTNLRERIISMSEWFFFGMLHILASNILSFLYNLSKEIPYLGRLGPTATPKRLKIIGSISVIISFVIFVATFAWYSSKLCHLSDRWLVGVTRNRAKLSAVYIRWRTKRSLWAWGRVWKRDQYEVYEDGELLIE